MNVVKDQPLISIIIPVYNVEKYLKQCLTSIIQQDYSKLEIILVDDGSTDDSLVICNEFRGKDKRIKVYHKENGGISSARNLGINKACGDYYSFVDSDDCVAKNYISYLLEKIKTTNSDIAICNYKVVEENWCLYDVDILDQAEEEEEIYTGQQIISRRFSNKAGYYTISCNKLYRAELFRKLRFVEGRCHEDEFMVRPLFEQCKKVVCCNKQLYFYRKRKGSVMDNALCDKCINDFLTCYENEIEYCRRNNNFSRSNMYKKEFCFSYVMDYQYLSKETKKYRDGQYRKYAISLLKYTKSKKVLIKYIVCIININFFRIILMPIFYRKGEDLEYLRRNVV